VSEGDPEKSDPGPATRQRADLLLVARGLLDSRAQAQAAIAAGLVSANGQPVRKASEMLPRDAALTAQPAHPYVSRGGVKLAAALDAFGFSPEGIACLDIGASTGGFTDVLLRRGAARVVAVDVGHGQLHPRIFGDRRVMSLEGRDIRSVTLDEIGGPVGAAVIDVSFISLALVLPAVVPLLCEGGWLVALIKPQFEVGRKFARGGIVRDDAARREACNRSLSLARELGLDMKDVIPSPITGGDGNVEFLMGGWRIGIAS
jgi:23S rRNA (cytidine1920-2'-O)/16S rRNA (cytidine1409-2'-O)-methyltransferase